MVLKVELVLTVYKQENEPPKKKKCRDKTPKGEKLPKLKNK